jgi:hypothetical protein
VKIKLKNIQYIRPLMIVASLVCIGMTTSCMTSYDAYGRPVQSVDPGLAVAGIAAAGIIGYAAAQNNRPRYYDNGYYDNGYYDNGYNNCGYRHY